MGDEIAIEERGSGEPLVLLHGVGTTRAIWHRVVPDLATDRRVVLVDVPGFGQSAPIGHGFELEPVANAIGDAMSERIGDGYDLVGTSLGGALAITLASERPASVRKLILAAPAGFRPHPTGIARLAGHVGAAIVRVRREIGHRALIGRPAGRRALLWGVAADGARIPPADVHLILSASRAARRVREAVRAAAAADLHPVVHRVRGPLGLLWGERDVVVPIANSRGIVAARPEAPFEIIANAGHIPHLESPREWTAAVRRLFDRLHDASIG